MQSSWFYVLLRWMQNSQFLHSLKKELHIFHVHITTIYDEFCKKTIIIAICCPPWTNNFDPNDLDNDMLCMRESGSLITGKICFCTHIRAVASKSRIFDSNDGSLVVSHLRLMGGNSYIYLNDLRHPTRDLTKFIKFKICKNRKNSFENTKGKIILHGDILILYLDFHCRFILHYSESK